MVDLPADAALSFAPPLVGDAATTGAESLSVSCSSSPQFMMAYMCVVVGPLVCRRQCNRVQFEFQKKSAW